MTERNREDERLYYRVDRAGMSSDQKRRYQDAMNAWARRPRPPSAPGRLRQRVHPRLACCELRYPDVGTSMACKILPNISNFLSRITYLCPTSDNQF